VASGRRQLRQVEQRVNHAVHARCRAEHTVEVVVADLVEQSSVVFLHDAGKAFDDANRRAQVVRNGVRKRLVIAGARCRVVAGGAWNGHEGQHLQGRVSVDAAQLHQPTAHRGDASTVAIEVLCCPAYRCGHLGR
jgi:hypothetical protein